MGTCRVTYDGALHAAPQPQELIPHPTYGRAQVTSEQWDTIPSWHVGRYVVDPPHSLGWVYQDTELFSLQGQEHQEQLNSPPAMNGPYCAPTAVQAAVSCSRTTQRWIYTLCFVMAAVITILSSPIKGCRAMTKVSAEKRTDTLEYSNAIAVLSWVLWR